MERPERHIAKCRRPITHLFRSESPAPDTVLMRVVHRIGMGPGCASSDSRSVVRRSACSLESAVTARAALRVWRGSAELPAILCCVVQLLVLVPPRASAPHRLGADSVLAALRVTRPASGGEATPAPAEFQSLPLSCDRDGQCARSPAPDAVLNLLAVRAAITEHTDPPRCRERGCKDRPAGTPMSVHAPPTLPSG